MTKKKIIGGLIRNEATFDSGKHKLDNSSDLIYANIDVTTNPDGINTPKTFTLYRFFNITKYDSKLFNLPGSINDEYIKTIFLFGYRDDYVDKTFFLKKNKYKIDLKFIKDKIGDILSKLYNKKSYKKTEIILVYHNDPNNKALYIILNLTGSDDKYNNLKKYLSSLQNDFADDKLLSNKLKFSYLKNLIQFTDKYLPLPKIELDINDLSYFSKTQIEKAFEASDIKDKNELKQLIKSINSTPPPPSLIGGGKIKKKIKLMNAGSNSSKDEIIIKLNKIKKFYETLENIILNDDKTDDKEKQLNIIKIALAKLSDAEEKINIENSIIRRNVGKTPAIGAEEFKEKNKIKTLFLLDLLFPNNINAEEAAIAAKVAEAPKEKNQLKTLFLIDLLFPNNINTGEAAKVAEAPKEKNQLKTLFLIDLLFPNNINAGEAAKAAIAAKVAEAPKEKNQLKTLFLIDLLFSNNINAGEAAKAAKAAAEAATLARQAATQARQTADAATQARQAAAKAKEAAEAAAEARQAAAKATQAAKAAVNANAAEVNAAKASAKAAKAKEIAKAAADAAAEAKTQARQAAAKTSANAAKEAETKVAEKAKYAETKVAEKAKYAATQARQAAAYAEAEAEAAAEAATQARQAREKAEAEAKAAAEAEAKAAAEAKAIQAAKAAAPAKEAPADAAAPAKEAPADAAAPAKEAPADAAAPAKEAPADAAAPEPLASAAAEALASAASGQGSRPGTSGQGSRPGTSESAPAPEPLASAASEPLASAAAEAHAEAPVVSAVEKEAVKKFKDINPIIYNMAIIVKILNENKINLKVEKMQQKQ
jgi:hypothetical protein